MQLFAIVIGIGVFDFGLDLVDTTLDVVIIAGAFDQSGLVLGDDHLLGLTQEIEGCGFKLETNFFADDLATSEDGDVLQHGLASLTKARSLDSDRLEGSTNLVDNQSCQCLAINIFGDDHQRTSALHDLFENRQHVAHGRDL